MCFLYYYMWMQPRLGQLPWAPWGFRWFQTWVNEWAGCSVAWDSRRVFFSQNPQSLKLHTFQVPAMKSRILKYEIIIPYGSMYAIYGNIYHQYTPNVSIYTIHGSYGS